MVLCFLFVAAIVSHQSLGRKIIAPVKHATTAAISTAAADTSLINFIPGWCSLDTKLQRLSIAVLNSSVAHTKPVAKIIAIHSPLLKSKNAAATKTDMVI